MTRPEPTPEQRAALDRAKKPRTNPLRAWSGGPYRQERDPQQVVPYRGRLVRS